MTLFHSQSHPFPTVHAYRVHKHPTNMARDRGAAQQGISTLLGKLNDPDPDIRFMQLSDLTSILNAPASDYLKNDTHTAARIIDGLLKALSDQNGEVQNQALKWLVCLQPQFDDADFYPVLDHLLYAVLAILSLLSSTSLPTSPTATLTFLFPTQPFAL
jgi:hypothetical protein